LKIRIKTHKFEKFYSEIRFKQKEFLIILHQDVKIRRKNLDWFQLQGLSAKLALLSHTTEIICQVIKSFMESELERCCGKRYEFGIVQADSGGCNRLARQAGDNKFRSGITGYKPCLH
jgi:hypothetical protein